MDSLRRPVPVPAAAAPAAPDTGAIFGRPATAGTPPFARATDRSAWITWTPRISRLALPRFQWSGELFAADEPYHLRYPVDARAVQVAVDPDRGTITTSVSAADVPLTAPREVPLEDYARDLTSASLRRTWIDESRRRINNVPADLAARTGPGSGPLSVRLPFELPKTAQSILGRGGPQLNVTGSERISIAGTSNWDNRISGTGVKRSLFPQLDMRQDLDIRLDGSLGDKVRVDVAQNSANTVPLANRIGIRYTGYDDEILKNLDLGNTNLSLPGTQYVSYSGRNEGLFGVKAAAKLGGTDLSLIASKQEGRSERRSFQGTAQEVVRQVDDLNYIKGKYFFLQRPAEQLATNSRIEVGTVRVFLDDRNGANDQGVRGGVASIDPTLAPGQSPSIAGSFDGLRELTDYEVTFEFYGERFPVLVLRSAISSGQVLGVTYEEVLENGSRRSIGVVPELPADPNVPADSIRVKLLQAPRDLLPARAGTDLFEDDPQLSPFAVTRDYEVKSFYDLQTQNIDPKSLTIEVRRYDAALADATDAYKEGNQLYPYLRILGADLFRDNGTGAPQEGADQIVDQFTNAFYLDTQRGILFFPDLRPFDPRLSGRPDARPEDDYFFRPRVQADQSVPGLRGRVLWPEGATNPPGLPPGTITPQELESNPNVYDKRNILLVNDRRYYIWAKFTGQDFSGTISLGQTNILEGSEVVSIEGVPLERNKDYSIDYEAGSVTLLTQRARENRSRLSIDYSYAPLFSQAGKTLVGGNLGYRDVDKSFGGAFIYESKGQQEARPRLGEEPSKTLIGDLYGQVSLKPQFLTDIADRLPLYSTTERSQFDINGEIGLSMPNPNTQNTVYLDDFEGNRDSYSAPMTRAFWKWAAPPLKLVGAATDTVDADYAELIWYNPYNTVKAGDLNPRLTANEGAENIVTALDFYLPREPAVREHPASMWTGITTTVEADGADFSRLQYLELWINDWRDPDVRGTPDLKLHIDLGEISEDQQRAPGVKPNGIFDTEDRNKDGKYDASNDPNVREDTGADGVANELETETYDLSTASSEDPHGDNFKSSPVNLGDSSSELARLDPANYVGPTLTEKSKGTYETGSRLYTEDLNTNLLLDTQSRYVTYTLHLGNEELLKPLIIASAESTLTTGGTPVAPNNGWRRYRIPLIIDNPLIRQVVNNGSLSNVKHMRVWLEGIQTFQGDAAPPKTVASERGRQPLIQLAAIDVVGNRWRIASADSALLAANGTIVARNVNNQEDRTIYDPPFEVSTQSRGGSSQTQREQSLALEVARLPLGSTATIFKDQTLAEDYTRYGRLGFYLAKFGFLDEDSARVFLRLGYDDRNYYEYSVPVRGAAPAPFRPTPWQSVEIDLKEFTDLKLAQQSGAASDTVYRGDERLVLVGAPTFTRMQRLTLGVYSEKAIPDSSLEARIATTMSGTIWVDDLRALDVDRATGVANRLTVFTKVADLFNVTVNWDRTDDNFVRLGQLRPADQSSNRISLSGQFQPHRFVGGSGVALPVSFSYARVTGTPRLRTGTDIFLEGVDARNEQSVATDRNFGVQFSKTGDRNGILRNTIGRLGLNFSFADRVARTPSLLDSSRTLSGGGSYSIAAAEWFRVPIPGLPARGGAKPRLLLLPQTATISFAMTTNRTFTFKRGLSDPVGVYALQSDIYRKSALYQLGATWRPVPIGTYSFSSTRNASIPGIEPARILGINFGRMTNFSQRIDGRITVPVHSFVRPAFDFATSYSEARTPDLSPNLALGQFQNSTNAGVTWELPFGRLATTAPRPAGPAPPPMPRRASSDSLGVGADTTRTAVPPPQAGGGGGFHIPVGRTLSRLGNVQLRGTFSRTTSFSRYFGAPSVPYRLGLARNPETQWAGVISGDIDSAAAPSLVAGPQATNNAQRTWSGDASTTIALFGRSNARLRANYTNVNRSFNTQVSNSANFTFPDLTIDWGSVHRVLRLGGVFNSINAQTRWSTVNTREGVNLNKPTSTVHTVNFSPLLSFTGQTKGQAQVTLSVDRRGSTREDFSTRRAVRREDETSFRGSISRSYAPGQRIPIFGGAGRKSTLTLSLDGTYNKRSGSTEAFGLTSSRTKTDRIDLNSSGTYSFSNYVSGTLGLRFSQNRDLQSRNAEGAPLVTRALGLEAAATIRF